MHFNKTSEQNAIPIRNNRLDVLLIQVPEVNHDKENLSANFLNIYLEIPIGSAYIAAVLEKEGYSVRILDMDAIRIGGKKLIQVVKRWKPRIIGFHVNTTLFKLTQQFAKMARDHSPSSLIICGGPEPSINPEICLKDGIFDLAIRGEGELTVIKIARRWIGDPVRPYDNFRKNLIGAVVGKGIRGLSYLEDDHEVDEPDQELIEDLDSIPFPARHLLPQNAYIHPLAKKHPHTSILMMRGCPFSCIFCSKVFTKVRCRSVQNVIDEIEQAINLYGIRNFSFLDAQLNLFPLKLGRLCIEIIKRGLKINFRFMGRVNPSLMPPYLIHLLKMAGCYQIAFGIESFNGDTLNFLQKGFTIEDVKKTVSAVQKGGIEVQGYYILGIPTEKFQDMLATLRSAKELGTLFMSYTILVPFPGTKLWELSIAKRWIYQGEYGCAKEPEEFLNFYDALGAKKAFLAGPNWNPEMIEKLARDAIWMYYFNPRMITKVLIWGTQNLFRIIRSIINIFQRFL